MAIDWTKPLETNEGIPVRVIDAAKSGERYIEWTDLSGMGRGHWFLEDGRSNVGASDFIRNVAETASETTDELAQLRALKADAIARFPELDEPESDEDAAERLENEYWESELDKPKDLAIAAFAWARANPR